MSPNRGNLAVARELPRFRLVRAGETEMDVSVVIYLLLTVAIFAALSALLRVEL
jgi:hypothetical protein